MAYRRKQQVSKVSTFKDEVENPDESSSSSSSSASSLATKAIRASSAYRDSSLSSAYGEAALSSPRGDSSPLRSSAPSFSTKDSSSYEYTSIKSLNEPKQGFWGVLARKAKSIIDDDNTDQPHLSQGRTRMQPVPDSVTSGQQHDSKQLPESYRKSENRKLQKGLDALASSFNYIGGTIGNAFEEGRAVVENRTADIIQETRKLQIRKKDSSSIPQNHASNTGDMYQQPVIRTQMQPQKHTDLETQLNASRDVAMAMAAKAKLLLRELKTVKADMAFAKERCSQLEEENRILRESREKGGNLEDDDLIRLQLETLLTEKARLAQDNTVLARENRFLREIVEYHQLTMQDVVYLDENSEEMTEVYPIKVVSPQLIKDIQSHPLSSSELKEVPCDVDSLSSNIHIPVEDDSGNH